MAAGRRFNAAIAPALRCCRTARATGLKPEQETARMADKKRINLALQGGGAHGAFTWGVLDRLLSDEDLDIAAISGTSAGALNGAALKAGMIEGGRAGPA